jgi:hypothetical protein
MPAGRRQLADSYGASNAPAIGEGGLGWSGRLLCRGRTPTCSGTPIARPRAVQFRILDGNSPLSVLEVLHNFSRDVLADGKARGRPG